MIFAIRAGKKIPWIIEDAEIEKAQAMGGKTQDGKQVWRVPLTAGEKFKETWKVYIPPVGMTLFGLGCFWGAHGLDLKRQAVLAGALATAQGTLEEYQRKVIELMGQKKHNDVREAISDDRLKQVNVPQETPAGLPGTGMTDIWFALDGHTFPSTYVKVKNVENEFNHEMMFGNEMYKSRAELYWKLDPSGQWLRPKGDDFDVGWHMERLLVLRVDNPFGPIATITYEDMDGLDYNPVPEFAKHGF